MYTHKSCLDLQLTLPTLFKSATFIFRLRHEEHNLEGGGGDGDLKKKFPAVDIMIGSVVLRVFFFFFFPQNQAAIQVSGEALTLAYTSKSFQWHLQLHSCFTGTLQALRTAASSKENLIPGAPSPQHIFSATITRASVNAGKINTGHG